MEKNILNANKVYCSLDIETSGFDPLTNEILEVGFVFFEATHSGLKVTEKWTQVFKPSKPVSSSILGLTGIGQAELDEAPKFSEFSEQLQVKLGNAVIVGHNIAFDIKFLESFGLKFSGGSIDTLDLVQWLLPTHHSYNLENLMHTFGIAHKEAHRALADSLAALKLLEKLLQTYFNFSEDLQNKLQKVLKPANFIWKDLLSLNWPAEAVKASGKEQKQVKKNKPIIKKLSSKTVYNFGTDVNYIHSISSVLRTEDKALLVLPKNQQVMDLLKKGEVDSAIFLPEWKFDEKKFASMLRRKNLSDEERKFALKILVWQQTNWQTETILDLNLSFFGGQFKSMITGGEITNPRSAPLAACDLATFMSIAESKQQTPRHIVICGLSEFESVVVANLGTKTSWGFVNYILKSFYNPELQTGDVNYKEPVEEALSASDLFFGLTSALLQSDPPGFMYFKISAQTENDERFVKIKGAARNFLQKLTAANTELRSRELSVFVENLQSFFSQEDNMVKWIELAENRCAFLSMPIKIEQLIAKVLAPYKAVSFADALGPSLLPNFFMKRLGLASYKVEAVASIPAADKRNKISSGGIQGDLFTGIKKVFGLKQAKTKFHYWPQAPTASMLKEIVSQSGALPAAILFHSPLAVKEFYDSYYQDLKKFASLSAQTNAGGSNKLFRNFSINPNGLLLATDRMVLRHLSAQAAVEPVSSLKVKTLIICRLPFEQFTHPYQEAVSAQLPNAFMDYALPKALLNFHKLVQFFHSSELQDVYVVDAKLSKDYSFAFKEYFREVPGALVK